MHNYHVTAATVRAGLDPNHGINDEPEYVEVYYIKETQQNSYIIDRVRRRKV